MATKFILTIRYTVAFVISYTFFTSCFEDPECLNLRNDRIGLAFVTKEENKEEKVNVFRVTLMGSDSVFYKNKKDISQMNLPLNVTQDTLTIMFEFEEQNMIQFDTLKVIYKTNIQNIKGYCNARYILSNLSLATSTFNEVNIINATPQDKSGQKTNINISL